MHMYCTCEASVCVSGVLAVSGPHVLCVCVCCVCVCVCALVCVWADPPQVSRPSANCYHGEPGV